MGGGDTHTIKALLEAEAYDGPAIIIAYAHCIAHGYDMVHGLEQQKAAVLSGYWPLMRYNPALRAQGKNPFQLDSRAPAIRLKEYAYREARYTMLARSNPELAARQIVEGGFAENYDYALQTLTENPYGAWREYDAEDTVRFYALRLREASAPRKSSKSL